MRPAERSGVGKATQTSRESYRKRTPAKRLGGLMLRDKIPKDVHTLFVGINPGKRSAEIGHYYGSTSNRFWKLLTLSEIWPTTLTALDDDKLVKEGFGFTDVAKRPTSSAADLRASDFALSRTRIQRLAERHNPKTVVFVGLTAARAYLEEDGHDVVCGLQDWRIHGSSVFVVPSTSGASQGHTNMKEKLRYFRRLKSHIDRAVGNAGERERPKLKG